MISEEFQVEGLPELPPTDAALVRSRISLALRDVPRPPGGLDLRVSTGDAVRRTPLRPSGGAEVGDRASAAGRGGETRAPGGSGAESEPTVEDRAAQYTSVAPRHHFDQLIVPDVVRTDLLAAVALLRVRGVVFGDWGLQEIEPTPRTALNFHGPPGVGKTLAAHALAHMLGKKILLASYADVESKYVGDGPKNVQALFMAAQRDDAVLFVDEADSLLSKRLTSVNAGSDQAINSMRSQLLIALEQFSGVVIFATNLVTNYDPAFETRVRSVEFTMPDVAARRAIWQAHLPARLPRAGVDLDSLAAVDDVCGRDIKNAVVDAAVRAAMDGRTGVTGEELLAAIRRVVAARPPTNGEGAALRPVELTEADEAELTGRISAALDASRTP